MAGGKDQHAPTLTELSDDRQAGAVDAESGDVHAQDLVFVGEGPGRDGEEGTAGDEQHLDDVGGDASVCEVAGFVIAWRGHGSDQDLEQVVELWGRRDGDRDGSGDTSARTSAVRSWSAMRMASGCLGSPTVGLTIALLFARRHEGPPTRSVGRTRCA